MKSPNIKPIIFLVICFSIYAEMFAQCPTVTNDSQVFCDLQSLLVSDLEAVANDDGLAWFDTATSVTPLSSFESLINGEDYYADNLSGNCGTRQVVTVTIIGEPQGLNFQGVCVDDPLQATIADLEVIGNNVQWYLTPFDETPLDINSVLIDETIYYADQSNPANDCRTSRLAVFVIIGVVPVPEGDAIQQFCVFDDNFPTIGDLIATGNNVWYPSQTSATSIDESTPLIDGNTYYATSIDPPCESDSRFEVTVEFIFQGSAGTNGTLDICEDDTSTFNLFDSLNGSPDSGGIWSPALASGSDLFDPAVDPQGTYTYTVASTNVLCEDASASVIVSIIAPPNAGLDGTLELCETDTTTYDLFDSLNGTPDSGGIWSPELTSGSGVFDPAVDEDGVYTYTVTSDNPACGNSDATVVVSFETPPNAGTNGTLDICEDDTSTFNLFDSLNGSPDSGGIWSPALVSGSDLFDPAVDPQGTYTYTVASTNVLCEDASASVIVSIIAPPNAGLDGTLELCETDTTTYDLFDSLNGTPDSGGIWSPELTSGSGVFDPAVDEDGMYTYTVTSDNPACGNSDATVVVSFETPPNAGTNGTLDICEDDTSTFNLFDSLNGSPDSGGIWSPALASGSDLFDPAVDSQGTYTYTVASTNVLCEDASASVIVSIIAPPNAGLDGTLELCETDTTTYDLFDSLNGTPDSGGIWSPELTSGSGVFDPAVDEDGVYTYTVTSDNPACGNSDATVVVSFETPPNAGTNGTLDICEDDTSTFNLFDSLNGSPDSGGIWSPALVSGSDLFDPAVDSQGTYTYTVASTNVLCEDASASVIVSIIAPPNAGLDGTLELCETDTTTYDLFDSLNGTPDSGGIWSPELTSGSGVFDPAVDEDGMYTYTVTSDNPACGNSDATVVVSFETPPNAGTNGTLDICEDDTSTFNLFDSLNGSPDSGGIWSPALASGSDLFDPAVDSQGTYTYTVASTNVLCEDASASVIVSIIAPPNAGLDGTLELCETDTTTYDLFDSLNGTPDAGGTWSPELTSGSGVFDPAVDAEGVYTYIVEVTECMQMDSSEVIISFDDLPDTNNLTINIADSCQGDDIEVSIGDAINLVDSTYTISLAITGANVLNENVEVSITNGEGSFIINGGLFENAGAHQLVISSLSSISNGCESDISDAITTNFNILERVSPELIEDGNSFCLADNPTIESLSSNIINSDSTDINWFDTELGGTVYSLDTPLQDGLTYHASITSEDGCESASRLSVTVSISVCIEDIEIPDGFSPNGDGINETFNIINLDVLYPNFKLSIFNRYGNILYQGNINSHKWDGTSNSGRSFGDNELPVGVYFFIIEFNDGIRKELQGRVYLNR